MDAIKTETIGDYLIAVYPDTNRQNPRDDDHLGTMVCFHKRYRLGDKHNYDKNDYRSWDELKNDIVKTEKAGVILPLYLYDHGGLAINTTGFSCPWDSGQIGFIFVSKEKILYEYGGKKVTQKLKDKVENFLKGEVEAYNKYLSGEVYGYKVYKVEDGKDNELDSCWGFYDEEECLNEAKGIVEYYQNK